jgi:hypothetical protein
LHCFGVSYYRIQTGLQELLISRIAKQFEEPGITKIVENVAKTRASELLTNEIQPEVSRFLDEITTHVQNFQVFLNNLRADFQRDYQELSKEVIQLKTRNNLTIFGDRAISDGDSEALDELQSLTQDSVNLTTKAAAIAEYRRVVSFWTLMSTTASGSFTVTLGDGTIKKDQENSAGDLICDF